MPKKNRWLQAAARARAGARNALELVRVGRLADPYGAPFEIVDTGPHHRLRRYGVNGASHDGHAPVALLIPPLMVTAEVYDIAPDVSAVAALGSRGIQPFVIDFGAPEHEEGGMRRTLDDHVRAVDAAITAAREIAGRDVHLCGYSQGGMFAYQAGAFRRGAGVRSIVTFGSPVDLHRSLPAVRRDVAGALVELLEPAARKFVESIEGLPGVVTSTAFKVVSTRKEIQQRVDFVRTLHDRNALVRREARRRFLGGEGFVAWPGPALRAFLDDFIVHNRMLSGGFVIDGRTVTLADLRCPILAFVGETDEIARPPTIRAIATAAPDADVSFASVHAGHFGLVVGSRAMTRTWPTVAEWVLWRDGLGPKPSALASKHDRPEPDDMDVDLDVDVELFFDTLAKSARHAWSRLGDVAASASDALDAVRYQEPRLRALAELGPETRTSPALHLAERAKESPETTFFLWRDRAFVYREADARVTNVALGLYACGVRPGDRVGVVMGSRPSFLSMVTALGRLGAVAVIAPPDAEAATLRAGFDTEQIAHVASDPDHAERVREATGRTVLVLGGGGEARTLPPGLVDMEAIDPSTVQLPADFRTNPGKARDLAVVLLRPASDGSLRAAPVTNHRFALSALGAAAACTIKPSDTVYCCIPLHHPTSLMVSVGAAITSGARLALADGFDAERFAGDVRRTGATVVFYAGDMLRPLLRQRTARGERSLPVRLFAGSGMRPDLARKLRDRFGIASMEFYAGTTQHAILANVSGDKPGALGRPLPGSDPISIVRVDTTTGEPSRDAQGELVSVPRGETGLLAVRAAREWVPTRDVVRRDDDGDYWFVDSLSGFVKPRGASSVVSTRRVEDVLYEHADVDSAAAFLADGLLHAAFVAPEPTDLYRDRALGALAALPDGERPARVFLVDALPLTEGFRPRKRSLPRDPRDARIREAYQWSESTGYVRLTS